MQCSAMQGESDRNIDFTDFREYSLNDYQLRFSYYNLINIGIITKCRTTLIINKNTIIERKKYYVVSVEIKVR